MWLERHPDQAVTVEISMTNGTEQKQYTAMTLDSSGPSDMAGRVEDFYKYLADLPAEKIAIKLSWTGDKPIYRITWALTQ
ncbi:hypothetical protein NCCP2716_01020 [Sporosarcina sp. NCCP-2716]|nr:hypothetical protein NCCP2716_01020 [Sporosarcina sp. NCCP-2716]